MQSIGVYDTLTCTSRSGPFTLQSRAPGLPTDQSNLVYRAADALWKAADRQGTPRDAHVRLDKAIPIAAGLGGGSADAAAALIGLNQIWELGRPREELLRIAAELGSDVPFFFCGGTAIGVGRGDEIYPVDDLKRYGVIVLKPAFGVSTSEAYRWCDEDRASGAASMEPRGFRPGVERVIDAGWSTGPVHLINDLEAPVARRHPAIGEMIEACMREGALAAAMTGSGSAVFGLFRETNASRAARKLRRPDWLMLLTRTVTRREANRRIGL